MTYADFPQGGPEHGKRRRGGREHDREERRNRWERGEPHEGPHEHRGHGRGRRGPFGPEGPFGPGGPFGFGGPGAEFFGGPGFGPRHRGRGRAGRGDVRAAIIALLAEEPRNGYQIIQEIEQRTDGVWRASSGSVYPALSQLEDEGLIEQVGDGGRKLFALTDAGREHAERNADQLGRIFEEAVGGGSRLEEFMQHRELVGQLFLAYKQVSQVGTQAQREEARAVLVKARQALYKILAADAPDDAEPEDSAPRDAAPGSEA